MKFYTISADSGCGKMLKLLILLTIISCCRPLLTQYYPPYIYKGFLSNVEEGSELKVLCFIPFLGESNTFRDEDGLLSWSWQRYDGIVGDDPYTQHLKPQNFPGANRSQILIEKILTFPRVLRKHEGIYWCNFTSPEHSGSDRFELRLKRNYTLKAKQNTQVFVPNGKDPVWVLEANFNTSLIDEVLWKKNYRLFASCEMDMLKTSSKYKVDTSSGSNIILAIDNADYEDTNNYNNLFIKSSALNLVFYLEVNFRIDVSVTYEDDIDETVEINLEKYEHLPGTYVTATCSVANKWKSSMRWKFLFKRTGPGMFWEEKKWKYEEVTTENGASFQQGVDGKENGFEVIQWKVENSGLLACTVEDNGRTLGTDVKHICVSTIPLAVFLEGPAQVAEGSDALLTCEVPQCQLFGDETIAWYYKDNRSSYLIDVSKVNATIRYNSLTKSQLYIKNFTADHVGSYICKFTTVAVGYSVQESIDVAIGDFASELAESEDSQGILMTTSGGFYAELHEEIDRSYNDAFYGFLLVPIALLIVLVAFYRRRAQRRPPDHFLMEFFKENEPFSTEEETERTSMLPIDSCWSFPMDKLVLGKRLEPGMFGEAFRAEAYGLRPSEEKTKVAVKLVKKDSDKVVIDCLVKEFKIMSQMDQHSNVVKLRGIALNKLEIAMIYDYCPFGRLLKYLRDNRHRFISKLPIADPAASVDVSGYLNPGRIKPNDMPLDTNVLISWSYQISRGMDWLASRKILHGDLAARNVQLTKNNVVQISDFASACDLLGAAEYQRKTNVKVPIKWMALESINDLVFSTQSDVWSFGVTVWEIFSLGDLPYSECATAAAVVESLRSGGRLKKPQHATDELHSLMLKCWQEDPGNRRSFSELVEELSAMLEDNVREMYLRLENFSSEG